MEKFDIKKILVPVDFSATAMHALKQAVLIAKTAGATIKIIHVAQEVYFPAADDAPLKNEEAINKSILKRSVAELKKIVKQIHATDAINIDYEIKSGNVIDTVCYLAEQEKFDLIIMGTHGVSGVKEFFAGSNSYKTVRHSICPVLTIQKNSGTINFKNIILPIRLERNSRQKVDYVVELARLFNSTVIITGYTDDTDENKQFKVKQYVEQVEKYLAKNSITYKSKLIFTSDFVKQILKLSAKSSAGLIVTMKEHDFSMDQIIKGSYSEQLVNHSTIPVLSIPVFSNPDMITYTPYLSGGVPY
ncbi:MAG: universal stress protein [Bacteroidota bacterium]